MQQLRCWRHLEMEPKNRHAWWHIRDRELAVGFQGRRISRRGLLIRRRRAPTAIGIAVRVALLAVVVATGVHLAFRTVTADTSNPVSFDLYATHPYASHAGFDNTSKNYYTGQMLCPPPSTFCPSGQTITDMGITSDGKLIAGYGDWNSNVDSFGVTAGRVGVDPLDLPTGTWGSIFYAGSEAIETVREINGHVYIPTTDPSDKAASGNPSGNISGYITDETGSWTFVKNGSPGNEHTLDVAAPDSTHRLTSGARTMSPQQESESIRGSSDSGSTWTDSYKGTDTSGWGRGYWLATLSGTTYAQKSYVDGAGILSWSGTTWQDVTGVSATSCLAQTMTTHLVTVFDNHILCGDGSGIDAFDGTTTTKYLTGLQVYDLYVYGGQLLILTNGGIFRTDSLTTPATHLTGASIPADARSIAAYDDTIYLGGEAGKIYKADATMSASTFATPTQADCFTFDSATGTITGYVGSGCSSDVVIPAAINGVPVTKIGTGAFSSKMLTSVVIANSVASIGDYAFSSNQLTSVIIPDSVTSIGNSAFSGNQIANLVLPNTIQAIGQYTFQHNKLTDLTIPSSIVDLGYAAFGYNELNTVTMPSLPSYVGDPTYPGPNNPAFVGNTHIHDVYINGAAVPDDLFAFTTIDTVHLSSDTHSIGMFAFYDSNIKTIDGFGVNITDLSQGSFGYNQLTSVTIPSSLTSIPESAFTNNLLSSVTIPDPVASIGSSAFSGNQLTSLTIPDSVTTIGGGSFASSGAFANNKLTSVTIPDSVTSLGGYAFAGNQITEATIPNSVTSMGYSVFDSNPLTKLTTDMTVVDSKNRVSSLTTLLLGPNVETIAAGAFQLTNLTSVTIGNSVKSIGDNAFAIDKLTSLAIPNSVTTIGNNAFSNNQLTSVTIPDSVTSVGDYAFTGNQITDLTIPNSVTSIGDAAFAGNQIANLTVPHSVTTLGTSVFANNPLANLIVDTETIPASNPYGTDISSLSLGSDVKTIGDSAFANTPLTSLSIPGSVTSIGASAFAGTQLTTVTIPASVATIGDNAFAGAQTSVVYMNGITTLGTGVFSSGSSRATALDNIFLACALSMNPPAQTLADYIPCYNDAVSQVNSGIDTTSEFVRLYTPYPDHYPSRVQSTQEQETTYSSLLGVPAPTLTSRSGILVNPVTVSATYRDTDGAVVAPGTTKVGPNLSGYKLSSAFALKPTLTDADLATMYYHQGDAITVMPPEVHGYVTPARYSGTLSAPTVNLTFTYLRQGQTSTTGTKMKPQVETSGSPSAGEQIQDGAPSPGVNFSERQAERAVGKFAAKARAAGITTATVLGVTIGALVVGLGATWWVVWAIRRRGSGR